MNTQEKEIIQVFKHLLTLLEVPVSNRDLSDYWQSHPDYLSMAFFADASKRYKMDYAALELTPADFGKNGVPFITHLVNEGGHFVVVENINESQMITYYLPSKGHITVPLKDFLAKWSGSVFYALPREDSGEAGYWGKRCKEIIVQLSLPLCVVLLLGMIIGSCLLTHPVFASGFLALFAIKIIGLFFCVNLAYHEVVGENRISQAVCQKGKYTSCDDVLQSPASQIGGVLMSDIGLVYFLGSILALLLSVFVPFQAITLSLLWIMAVCSIPYGLFSICYQLFRIKKICPFCMSVIFTLCLEWIWALTHFPIMENVFNWQMLFPMGCFLLSLCAWITVKPILLRAKDGSEYKYKYLRLKKNPHIFNASLEKMPSVDMEIKTTELIVGNPESTTTITTIVNTHCAPCARMERRISSILKDFEKDIRIVFRFMLAGNNRKETLYLIRLYYAKGASVFAEALHDWYQNRDYKQLMLKYQEVKESSLENGLIQQWNAWYAKNQLSSTPTVFLNDKKIEQEYDIDDIRWLVQNCLYEES